MVKEDYYQKMIDDFTADKATADAFNTASLTTTKTAD